MSSKAANIKTVNLFEKCNDFAVSPYYREKIIKNGVYKETYYDVILFEIPFINGKRYGVAKFYQITGEIWIEVPYINDVREGLAKAYYINGNLKYEVNYHNDKQHGIRKNYDKTGNLIGEFSCKNGSPDGSCKIFSNKGALKVEFYCCNGLPEGNIKNYYQSGELNSEGFFEKGKINGIVKEYYKSGIIKAETEYLNNFPNGTSKNYYESGKLKSKGSYEDGEPVGEHIAYDRYGNIKNIEFYINGKLKKTEQYEKGNLISTTICSDEKNVPLEKLYKLIDLMKNTPVYTQDELKKLWEKDRERELEIARKMLDEHITYGQASGEYDFLNKETEEFREYLKSINNDLDVNIEIVRYGFEKYIERGDAPFPYYAERIAVILSKNKMYKEEREFLYEWCRHFLQTCGTGYRDIVNRARNKGAI